MRGQHNLAVPVAVGELGDQRADAALDHIVAQEHDETVIAKKVGGDLHRMGQAQRLILGDVGDLYTPAGAIAHSIPDALGRCCR